MKPIPLIRASAMLAYVEFLAELGTSTDRLWAAAGLPSRALFQPDLLVPLRLAAAFAEKAAASEGIGDLGIRVARRCGLEAIGRFGVAIRRAPTLARAIEVARDQVTMHNSGASYWVVDDGPDVRLCRRFRTSDMRFRQSDLFSVALMVDLVRVVAGPGWLPARVELQSTGAVLPDVREAFGDARIEVDRPVTSITFPRIFLARPLVQPDPAPALPAPADATRPPDDFLSSLEAVIGTLLEAGNADLATAARVAGTSVRSFQRRLTELDASYSEMVDLVRFRTATRLLEDTGTKIIEIALALGYSDPAHFTRAFRRWTSVTPMEYRHMQLNGEQSRRRSA